MQEMTKTTTNEVATDDGFGVSENRSGTSLIIGKMVKFTNDGPQPKDDPISTSPKRMQQGTSASDDMDDDLPF